MAMPTRYTLIILITLILSIEVVAQEQEKPVLLAGSLTGKIILDGMPSENSWLLADSITELTMVEPREHETPTYPTVVRVLADKKHLYFGIICYDDDPADIVAFTKARDARLENEDNIKIVLDPYFDGRNGFIFTINPYAARYDAIVSNSGEGENQNWDGIWEANTVIGPNYWSAEIRIPIHTLTFKKGSTRWGFNIERRVQRLLEVNRWTAINQDHRMGQTIHAGILGNLPAFNLGIGLTPVVSTLGKASDSDTTSPEFDWKNSLDILQRITPDITAQISINTDFAETEVDSRRTNLTRFPILYPEKRQFYLEGADIYDFGLGLGRDFMPFFSRRIGLYERNEVPVRWGAKVNGKLNRTHFGVLANETGSLDTLPRSTMGVVRVKQNIWKESSFGMIGTLGDPAGLNSSWLAGADFTYQTSTFKGDKNFMVGVWGLLNNRQELEGDKTAIGFKIDYPNDLWDIAFTYRRIGDAFDPSLGFVPRRAYNMFAGGANYMPRPDGKLIRQHIMQSRFFIYTDLKGRWESYDIFTAPVHFLLESGDRFEFNIRPTGESLTEPFEISDGVVIPEGDYHWMRYRLELEGASKRRINGMATWWFGSFYGGSLHQIDLKMNWRPISTITLEMAYERNIAELPYGDFTRDLFSSRLLLNISSNLNISTYWQYDNDTQSIGSYSRLRWTFLPRGDLFIVYKHNLKTDITSRWEYESNQLIFKLSYGIAL